MTSPHPAVDPRFDPQHVAAAYDLVAHAYDEAFGDELDHLPVVQQQLERAAAVVQHHELGLEVGAGPGQATRHLIAKGCAMVSLDLSTAMLRTIGNHDAPSRLIQADLRSLPVADASVALVVARYVLQHLERAELDAALHELRRVLRPGGALVLSTHLGTTVVVVDELLGTPIPPIGGTLHDRADLIAALQRCRFEVRDEFVRSPRAGEYPSERLYVLAAAVAPSNLT